MVGHGLVDGSRAHLERAAGRFKKVSLIERVVTAFLENKESDSSQIGEN